jgi:cytosine/adenosine deaminase-related metal-dependent hydrolase
MSLYLKNTNYIDWQTFEIKNTNIKIEQGVSGGIEFIEKIPENTSDKIINCNGKFVTKSFGCGHHHIYSTLARGMPAPKKIPENFVEILQYIWWHLDKKLDLDMIRASALASAIYCAKNGVTFIIDHHASPNAVKGSLNVIAEAFDEVGISHLLCYELSNRDGDKIAEEGLLEHEDFLSKGNQGHVGLHASFTVNDELLKNAVELAKKFNTGVHIHVAEDKADQEDSINKYSKRVVERLNDFGALDLPRTILSHCIHLDENEKKLIKNKGSWVAENIESNLNNNVGVADYKTITDKIMLGTDGMHSDMLRSAKAAFLSGQFVENPGFDTIYNRFRNIHKYISENNFKGDADNNLVILNYDSPTELTSENFLGHFIYGIDSSHVETVISKGEIIVENKKITKVNEEEVLSFAKKEGLKLWEKMSK